MAGRAIDSGVANVARGIVASARGVALTEREAKRVLALYGIPVTRETLATTAEEAVQLANAIGYPVALKIESRDIPHKTEASGVLVDRRTDGDVLEGFERIMENAMAYEPDAELGGVLVQAMVSPGRELLLGMSRDADFGPAIAVGFGGVWVETLRDTSIGVPPLTDNDAWTMLRSLRGFDILEGRGARGGAPADLKAVVDILTRFSQMCLDIGDLVEEIDVNPLVVHEAGVGARVVDCLIVPRRGG